MPTSATAYQLRSSEMTEDSWELVFEIRSVTDKLKNELDLMAKLKALKHIKKVSLLAPKLVLPV